MHFHQVACFWVGPKSIVYRAVCSSQMLGELPNYDGLKNNQCRWRHQKSRSTTWDFSLRNRNMSKRIKWKYKSASIGACARMFDKRIEQRKLGNKAGNVLTIGDPVILLTLLVGMDRNRLNMASISVLLGASAIAKYSTFGCTHHNTSTKNNWLSSSRYR